MSYLISVNEKTKKREAEFSYDTKNRKLGTIFVASHDHPSLAEVYFMTLSNLTSGATTRDSWILFYCKANEVMSDIRVEHGACYDYRMAIKEHLDQFEPEETVLFACPYLPLEAKDTDTHEKRRMLLQERKRIAEILGSMRGLNADKIAILPINTLEEYCHVNDLSL